MKILQYISLLLFFISCKKNDDTSINSNNSQPSPPSKLLLLRVDYLTKTFEGGIELPLGAHTYLKDSIPLRIDYRSPGDFGYLKLFYRPTNDTIFDGSIIWMGSGKMTYPAKIDTSTNFHTLGYSINKPDSNRFQLVHFIYPAYLKDSVPWAAISKLDVVRTYLPARKKIGYFLYTPSVGIGNPAEWDWFFILSK